MSVAHPHRRRRRVNLSHVVLASSVIFGAAGTSLAQAPPYRAVKALDWTRLLDRDYGWNAADGCVSVPLNGIEAPGVDPHPRTLFLFGDSIIGDVDQNGRRLPGNEFINNSMLYVDGPDPDPSKSEFIYVRDNGQGHPRSAFVPQTSDAQPGDYFWLMEGIALGEQVHLFGIHLRPPEGGGWPLNQGITMITIGKDSVPPFDDQV